jgi:hypothetical protein
MPGPVLTLRFDEIALMLAGFDDRMDAAGFAKAEWVKADGDRFQTKPDTRMPGFVRPLALTAVGIIIALAVGGAIWLWAHVGTMVFFETIRTGFVACFG